MSATYSQVSNKWAGSSDDVRICSEVYQSKRNGFFNHCMKICKQGGKCSNIVKRRQGCSLGAFFFRVFVFVFLANSRNLSLSQ